MRVHKYMALCGVASRRKSEVIVQDGRVKVNGELATINSAVNEGDKVTLDGHIITLEEKKVYLMLNKPLNCVTTSDDQFDRTTVMDFINEPERVYPIGRLDYNTTGMLLLTNDGDLANKIMHPSSHLTKTYVAKIKGTPTKEKLVEFEKGLMIDDRMTSPAKIRVIREELVEVQIYEGRNRQVRKMLEIIGHPVITLKRIRIGTLSLGELELSTYRHLTDKELSYLKEY